MRPFDLLFRKKKRKGRLFLGERQSEQRVLADGAHLLRELIAYCEGKVSYPIRIFSAEELITAIDDFHCKGWFSFNYKGTYQGRRLFVKRFVCQRELAFTEIISVIQINHINVVKLLGCCFEMELPVLVYELFPSTLYRLLYTGNSQGSISWENRLRIATETAHAVTYLHTAKPTPIAHRNISSSNILLDENYRPKLCGFALSVAIPLDETDAETRVAETYGYLKADVCGFGWLLLELLSGKRPHELRAEAQDEGVILDDCNIEELKKGDRLDFILDSSLSGRDGKQVEQSNACVDVALRCIAREPDHRPTIKEVAQKLLQMQRQSLSLKSEGSCHVARITNYM